MAGAARMVHTCRPGTPGRNPIARVLMRLPLQLPLGCPAPGRKPVMGCRLLAGALCCSKGPMGRLGAPGKPTRNHLAQAQQAAPISPPAAWLLWGGAPPSCAGKTEETRICV